MKPVPGYFGRFFWKLVTPINDFSLDCCDSGIRLALHHVLNAAKLDEMHNRVKEMLREDEL